jgi:hypothetical protein
MIVLGILGAGILWAWGLIIPFIVAALANTLYAIVLVVAIAAVLGIIFSPKTHLMFRLAMRALTGFIINIDPIGILKDRVAQLAKRLEQFYEQMKSLRGAIRTLSDNRLRNEEEMKKARRVAANAKNVMETAAEDTDRIRAATELRVAMRDIDRMDAANKRYATLQTTLERVHKALERASLYMEGHIKDANNEARHYDVERKALKAGRGALATAVRVFRGKADENDIYNQTLEKLADDASQMMGEMDENLRWTEEFMAKIDLQTGALPDDAMLMLKEFEQKMLPPATPRISLVSKPTVVDAEYSSVYTRNKKEGK